MDPKHEWLYRALRAVLEESVWISDDVDVRLIELTAAVLNHPTNAAVVAPNPE